MEASGGCRRRGGRGRGGRRRGGGRRGHRAGAPRGDIGRRAGRGGQLDHGGNPDGTDDQRRSADGEEHAARGLRGRHGGRGERRRGHARRRERRAGDGRGRRADRGPSRRTQRRVLARGGASCAEARGEGEGVGELGGSPVALRGLALEGAQKPRVEGRGQARHRHRRRGDRRRADLDEQVADALALEGQDARHALVGDDSQGPEVGAVVDVAEPARLLGRHVVRRSQDGARLGAARETFFARGRLDLGDAEVEHLGDLVVVVGGANEEDVLRLEVPVDDPRVVRALQGAAHVADDPRRLAQRDRPQSLDSLVERLAQQELHDHVRSPVVGDAVVEDLDGVLALDRRRRARFGHEPCASFFALDVLGVDELDGDTRPEAGVPPLPHRAHAAAADQAKDLVLAGDQSFYGREGVTHTGGRCNPDCADLTLDESPPDG